MRLATRTALAAFIAASLTLLLAGAIFQGRLADVLQDRVDAQLEDRAESAPILAAIAERLGRSELAATVAPARVVVGDAVVPGGVIELGDLPESPLPAPDGPGWTTFTADGERWRLYAIEVVDVPDVGDRALVQLVEPLGDVDREAGVLRRRFLAAGVFVSFAAGAAGWLLGAIAARPLTRLRRDTASLREGDPAAWQVGDRYGTPEVDDVAAALNINLRRLSDETVRRDRALDAARAFAASASHELRTPLQSALTNLDIARSERASADERIPAIEHAHDQVQRMAASLTAVRALADAEFADPAWFEPTDLVEVIDRIVADERRRYPLATIELVEVGDGLAAEGSVTAWRDGVQLAVGNVVRNALVHGGDHPHVIIEVRGSDVIVDDDGPGVPAADRDRLVGRFAKGERSTGSGLGLAIAAEVTAGHGGRLMLDDSPLGGLRVVVRLAGD